MYANVRCSPTQQSARLPKVYNNLKEYMRVNFICTDEKKKKNYVRIAFAECKAIYIFFFLTDANVAAAEYAINFSVHGGNG